MRAFTAVVTLASLVSNSVLAFDPSHGQGWQRSRPAAAVAYFKLPLQAWNDEHKASYGLALTAPLPRRHGASPLSLADAPKLADVRFNGIVPETLLLSQQAVWSTNPDQRARDGRQNLVGGPLGWVFNLALTGAAIYGVYSLVKKECPAISTTTGGCVDAAN
jgi:hypothetical protein